VLHGTCALAGGALCTSLASCPAPLGWCAEGGGSAATLLLAGCQVRHRARTAAPG
jgi:hypothetical protein